MTTAPSGFDVDFLTFEQNGSSATGQGADGWQGGTRLVRLAPGFDLVFFRHPHRDSLDGSVQLFRSGAEGLLVEEHAGGTVPTLVAHNSTNADYLLIAGQLLSGGKQNRGLNADLLVGAGQRAEIPVTCVEQGRWSAQPRGRFHHAGIEPLEVRASKHRDVSSSMRAGAGHRARQDQVWKGVADLSRDLGATNARSDLLESMAQARARRNQPTDATGEANADAARDREEREEAVMRIEHMRSEVARLSLEIADVAASVASDGNYDRLLRLQRRQMELFRSLRRALEIQHELQARPVVVEIPSEPLALDLADACAKEATGLLVYFDGEFVAGDLFASGAWFETLYPDLRESALMSWERVRRHAARLGTARTAPAESSVAAHAASTVREALRGSWHEKPTPAHGRHLLLEHDSLEGSVLCRERTPLHLLLGTKQVPAAFRAAESPRA